MRILVIGLDRSVAETGSFSAQRQREYYKGWEADTICIGTGFPLRNEIDSLHFFAPGGKNKVIAFWNAYKKMRDLLSSKKYDIITSQDAQWTGLLAWTAHKKYQIPWQIQDHSGFFGRRPFFFSEKCLAPFARWFVRQATRVRTVSERGKRGLIACGVHVSRIDVVPVFTTLPSIKPFVPRETVHCVFSVGRLEREKGYDVLLQAWKKAALTSVKLVIAGDGSERTHLEKMAASLGISSSVSFLGWQSQEQLVVYWEKADIYVQPSWFEGWPRAPWEALHYGLPCILTDTGFVGEAVTGTEVVVVPPGNVEGLALALKAVFVESTFRQTLRNAVRRMLERTTIYQREELIKKNRESLLRTLR